VWARRTGSGASENEHVDDWMESLVPDLNRLALSVPGAGGSPRMEVVVGTTQSSSCLDMIGLEPNFDTNLNIRKRLTECLEESDS